MIRLTFDKCETYVIGIYISICLIFNFLLGINLFYAEILLMAISFSLFIIFSKNMQINKSILVWGVAFCIAAVSCAYSVDSIESIKYCILLIFFIWSANYIGHSVKCRKVIADFLWIGCGFHFCMTLFQFLCPDSFYIFFNKIASGDWLADNIEFYRGGRLCGITNQTGINGFILSIFVIITFNKLLNCSNRLLRYCYFILLIASLFLLGMTGKRLFFIGVIFVFILDWYLKFRQKKSKIKYLGFSIIISIIMIFFFDYLGIIDNLIDKFIVQYSAGDITNGRIGLWLDTLKIWKEHIFLGVGIRGISSMMMATHNVYIQLLADIGIIGAIIFYIALLYPAYNLLKKLKRKENIDYVMMVSLSIQLFFLIYCFTGNPLYDHKMMWIYAISVGLSINKEKIKNDIKQI